MPLEDILDDEEQNTSSEKKYLVVIIYDISNNKHRTRIFKYLESFGIRVQRSAFEARLTEKQYQNLITGLQRRIDKDDNMRVYKLRGYEEVQVFGEETYADDADVITI